MKPTQSRIIGYEKEFKTTLKKIRTKFKKYKKNKSDLFNHVRIHNEKKTITLIVQTSLNQILCKVYVF